MLTVSGREHREKERVKRKEREERERENENRGLWLLPNRRQAVYRISLARAHRW